MFGLTSSMVTDTSDQVPTNPFKCATELYSALLSLTRLPKPTTPAPNCRRCAACVRCACGDRRQCRGGTSMDLVSGVLPYHATLYPLIADRCGHVADDQMPLWPHPQMHTIASLRSCRRG
jgi:hypothetical protein